MKNLYKLLFCLLFFYANSQNDLQNANWIFGNRAWLNFNNNNVIAELPIDHPLTAPYETNEGCASVSDEDGNLLFYTDGESVFRLDNGQLVLITNQLFGDTSSSQNVIIIPRPGFSNRYYIVTITGFSTNSAPKGVFFSEIDMTTWTMIGQINQTLSDGNLVLNNLSPNTFNNTSEAITSCIAANGIDYWLVFHAEDNNYSRILSYLVTENGIDVNPSYIFPMPNNPNNSLSLKVSPDTNRIALGQNDGNPLLGTFNNFDGEIDFNLTPFGIINNGNQTYSVEFSPDSNILYYSAYNNIDIVSNVFAIDIINNQQTEVDFMNDYVLSSIQRAINGNLYVARRGVESVLEISDPNDLLNFQTTIFSLQSVCNAGLPQWIWSSCQPTLIISSPGDDVNGFVSQRERSEWIDASNRIFSTANTQAIYHAGEFVELNPGFEADFGAQFSAYIEGCSNEFQYRQATSNQSKDIVTTMQLNQSLKNITINPNPSSNIIEIQANNDFTKVTIVSLEGRIVFDKENDKTNSIQVDVSGFAKGVYLVSVTEENGMLISKKLIKN